MGRGLRFTGCYGDQLCNTETNSSRLSTAAVRPVALSASFRP